MSSPFKRSLALLCLGAVLIATLSLAHGARRDAPEKTTDGKTEEVLEPDVG